ncbi:MAG TPA: hypothetical protein VLJ86_19745 [Ramlibacter sp.]|nr:hypothetical protein [Ramlibacter sp.]
MLKIFRQLMSPQPASEESPSTPARVPTRFFRDKDALPEVSEGNTEADWALWEDSVAAFEQQGQADTVPAPLQPDQSASAIKGKRHQG